MSKRKRIRRYDVPEPRNEAERKALCGFNASAMEAYWDKRGDMHQSFFLAQQTEAPPDTVRLWELVIEVTGEDPDITPQPTGNCVAAACGESCEVLQCSEIAAGQDEEFRRIFNPFHYATGRVLVMKNSLKGQAGANGGAVAEAMKLHGVIQISQNLPVYNKANVDAWGDGRSAQGKSFRDFLEEGAKTVIQSTARITSMSHLFESLGSRYPLTIASNTGYSMKPNRDGFHQVSTTWSHQMSIWGYSISGGWIGIKNQWGDVHGDVVDHDGEEWPPGFLKVRIEEFEKRHFRGAEVITYSNFKGFPQRKYDHRALA